MGDTETKPTFDNAEEFKNWKPGDRQLLFWINPLSSWIKFNMLAVGQFLRSTLLRNGLNQRDPSFLFVLEGPCFKTMLSLICVSQQWSWVTTVINTNINMYCQGDVAQHQLDWEMNNLNKSKVLSDWQYRPSISLWAKNNKQGCLKSPFIFCRSKSCSRFIKTLCLSDFQIS